MLAFTPTSWWALENLRIVAPNGTGSSVRAVQAYYSSHVRIVDCRFETDVQSNLDAGWYTMDFNCIRPGLRKRYSTTGVSVGGATTMIVRNGSKDCVYVDATIESVSGTFFDCLSSANFVPTLRGEIHGVTDETPLVTVNPKHEVKYGAHATITDCLYWRLHSKFGGLSVQGWKSDINFANLGDNEGKASMLPDAGLGDCYIRHSRHVAPSTWFAASCGVERCHFHQLRMTTTPGAGNIHTARYGSGANVNTYKSGAADTPHSSWVAV